MRLKPARQNTTVGAIRADVLAYTAGRDAELDRALIEADCLGSAAHVTMLSEMPVRPRLFSPHERARVIAELARIIRQARTGAFAITLADQDVHLAVERVLTRRLGGLGRKIHTARSRNDQVAVDLRLFGKQQLLGTLAEVVTLRAVLVTLAAKHRAVPMVGRTHLQPAMPSSVGLWASAGAESLDDDFTLLRGAYDLNDQCPLGAAAGYGVPLPIDRQRVSNLLGFRRPLHNVLYAVQARGKIESVILSALAQVMLTLSRLAEDLLLFSMPEFQYFSLPAEMGTGSSIMPQKNNPDVLELVRARTARVVAAVSGVMAIIKALPSGYNRDLQETKEPFLEGFRTTRASLCIMATIMRCLRINRPALLAGFTPAVFAADAALEQAARGVPFRDAYRQVKARLPTLAAGDPRQAIARKTHLGATAGLNFALMKQRMATDRRWVRAEQKRFYRALSRLLRRPYPIPESV